MYMYMYRVINKNKTGESFIAERRHVYTSFFVSPEKL